MKLTDGKVIGITCCLIFSVSSAYCLWTGNQTRWGDERDYVEIATRLVAGHGFVNDELVPTAFRPPGYPFVIALVFHINESLLLAKLLNAAALAVTAWILSLIVRQVAPQGQIFAPLLVLAFPLFIYVSGALYPQTMGGFLFVFAIYWLIRSPKSWLAPLVSGIIFGVLILMIPSFALVYLFATLLLVAASAISGVYSAKFIGMFLLATLLVVTPWVVRSSLLFERFVFVSTNSGINLLYGNSENTEYDSGIVDISNYSINDDLNEAETDSYYRKAAIDWVMSNPTDAIGLYLKKVVNYFNFKNQLTNKSEESVVGNVLMFLSYYPLLVVALIRCAMWRRLRFTWPEFLLYSLYFANAFLAAVVFTRIRYRVPFDFLLVAMVSIFFGHIRESKFMKTKGVALFQSQGPCLKR